MSNAINLMDLTTLIKTKRDDKIDDIQSDVKTVQSDIKMLDYKFDVIDKRIDGIDKRIDEVRNEVKEVSEKMDKRIDEVRNKLGNRIDRLETKVDSNHKGLTRLLITILLAIFGVLATVLLPTIVSIIQSPATTP